MKPKLGTGASLP